MFLGQCFWQSFCAMLAMFGNVLGIPSIYAGWVVVLANRLQIRYIG